MSLSAYEVAIRLRLVNEISAGMAGAITQLKAANSQAATLQDRLTAIGKQFRLGLGMATAGVGIAAAFVPAIAHAEKFERALLRIKNIGGITPTDLTRLRTTALSGALPMTATGTVEAFKDLHLAFGDAKDAFAALPQFAKFAAVGRIAYGKSESDNDKDLLDLGRVAEKRGGNKGPQAMADALDLVARIRAASGGVLGGRDLLAFSNTAGAAFRILSNTGLAQMMGVMAELKGGGAGTGFMSALQNLAFGRGTEQSGHYLRKLGLVDEGRNAAELRDLYGASWAAHKNKVAAGSLKGVEMLQTAPVQWVQTYLVPALRAAGMTTDQQMSAGIVQVLSNRTGAKELGLIATQLPAILRDFRLVEASQGIDGQYQNAMASPVGKIDLLKQRFDTGLVNLGEAALPIVVPLVERLTTGLSAFNKAAERDPELLQRLSQAAFALSTALVGAGLYNMVTSTAKAFGLLGGAMKVLPVGAAGLAGLASGITALGVAVVGLPPMLKTVAEMLGFHDVKGPNALPGAKLAGVGVARDPSKSWLQESLMDLWNAPATPGGNISTRRSAVPNSKPTVTVQVQSTINADGKKLADVVTTHQAREVSRPQSGQSGFDGRTNLMPPGMGYAR